MSLLDELISDLGVGREDLLRVIANAPRRYKVYQIPKRSGGQRTIAQPSKELKLIQRYVLTRKLEALPVHAQASAYAKGRNILENAEAHVGQRVILKLDFQNFFPSIRPLDFARYVRANRPANIEVEDLPHYARILFWGGGTRVPMSLSIGAPTSPTISNVIMFGFDSALSSEAVKLGVRYTRYADDITASANDAEALMRFESICRRVVSKMTSPRLSFNEEKRGMYFSGQRRMVTGLVLTPTSSVSIGRERKREISALFHRANLGQLDADKVARLKGLVGFCLANEPEFISRMRSKYGNRIVDFVLAYQVPARTTRRQ